MRIFTRNAIDIGKKNVLFINGNYECYSPWQYVIVAYLGLYLLPFVIVLIMGPTSLETGVIISNEFLWSALCPAVFVVIRCIRYLCQNSKKTRDFQVTSAQANAIISVVQGPFRPVYLPKTRFSISWAGILLVFRL